MMSGCASVEAVSLVCLRDMPDGTSGLCVAADTNVLLILGAGTQGFFNSALCFIPDHATQVQHFMNDALLNELAVVLERNAMANGMPARFAVVTLNITWNFPKQFSFHGTLGANDIPTRTNTTRHMMSAMQYVRARFRHDMGLHVFFIGVGMTKRNGVGFPAWLASLQRSGMNIANVTVVDPVEKIGSKRKAWLKKKCNIPVHQITLKHVRRTASDWISSLTKFAFLRDYHGPLRTDFFAVLQSRECITCITRAGDPYVLELVRSLVSQNGLRLFDVKLRSRNQHAVARPQAPPLKIISRMHPDVSESVLIMAQRKENDYWLGKQVTRVVTNIRGDVIEYIEAIVTRYISKSNLWSVSHCQDGREELLELYEVILGVQLHCVRANSK